MVLRIAWGMEAASFFVFWKLPFTTTGSDEKDTAYSPTGAFAEDTPQQEPKWLGVWGSVARKIIIILAADRYKKQ